MRIISKLKGQRVRIDTAPVIYFIEKYPKYIGLLHPFFAEIDNGKREFYKSENYSTQSFIAFCYAIKHNDNKSTNIKDGGKYYGNSSENI